MNQEVTGHTTSASAQFPISGGGVNAVNNCAMSGGSTMITNHSVNTAKSSSRLCRDFVRGNCRRKNCRYPHVLSPELVVFCHDYQNATCPRINCKFLHYTLQEEEYYRMFGEFPQYVMENGHNCGAGKACGPSPLPSSSYSSNFSPCHDRSGGAGGVDPFNQLATVETHHVWNDHLPSQAIMYRSNGSCIGPINRAGDEYLTGLKRGPCETVDSIVDSKLKRFREDSERIDIMQMIRRFEEDQSILRRRVEANEIKIAELRASNEYLMAQLRLHNHQQCSTVVNPVTVTQTTSQPPTQQVLGGVSIAPVQMQTTPIVSIATPQTQLIAAANSGTPLALAAATTSQAQQQIAIATGTPQSITSLTSTSQSLQPTHGAQLLGTSQITLTPVAPASALGLAINTSQATLSMSNAAPQPIISYPVMTHSLMPHQ